MARKGPSLLGRCRGCCGGLGASDGPPAGHGVPPGWGQSGPSPAMTIERGHPCQPGIPDPVMPGHTQPWSVISWVLGGDYRVSGRYGCCPATRKVSFSTSKTIWPAATSICADIEPPPPGESTSHSPNAVQKSRSSRGHPKASLQGVDSWLRRLVPEVVQDLGEEHSGIQTRKERQQLQASPKVALSAVFNSVQCQLIV